MDNKALARLVERAQRGDSDAFAQIYSHLSKLVYYLSLKMVKNEQDAVDVMQETFLRLFQNLPSVKDGKTLVAYVNRIVYNCSLDTLSKAKRIQMDDSAETLLQNAVEENAEFLPEEYFEKEELRSVVLRGVEELNESQKSVILLYYFEHLSVRQIAEVTRINDAAVMNRLSRARAALKQKLFNNHTEGGVYAMAVPVLSRILQAEADARFTSELSEQVWTALGGQLGIPTAIIAATAVTASAGAAVPASAAVAAVTGATAAAAAMPAVANAGMLAKMTGIFAAAVIVGGCMTAAVVPGPVHDYVQEVVNMENSPLSFLQDIFPGIPPDAGLDISDSPIPPPSALPVSPRPGGQTVTTLPPGEPQSPGTTPPVTLESTIPTASPGAEIPPASVEAFLPAQSNWPPRRGYSVTPPQIAVKNALVTYPAGTPVSQEELLRQAGVTGLDTWGNRLELTVHYYDQIDFDTPGQYPLLIDAAGPVGNKLSRVGVIVEIS